MKHTVLEPGHDAGGEIHPLSEPDYLPQEQLQALQLDRLRTVVEHAYEHEQKVTGLINNLVDLSIAEQDHATNNFLQWFVAEQVEEDASADEVVQKIKLMGDASGGLFMLDRELAQRVFTPPATAQ